MKILEKAGSFYNFINKNKVWIFLSNIFTVRDLYDESRKVGLQNIISMNFENTEFIEAFINTLIVGVLSYCLWIVLKERSQMKRIIHDHTLRLDLYKEILSSTINADQIKLPILKQSLTNDELWYLGFSTQFVNGSGDKKNDGKAEANLTFLTPSKGRDSDSFKYLNDEQIAIRVKNGELK